MYIYSWKRLIKFWPILVMQHRKKLYIYIVLHVVFYLTMECIPHDPNSSLSYGNLAMSGLLPKMFKSFFPPCNLKQACQMWRDQSTISLMVILTFLSLFEIVCCHRTGNFFQLQCKHFKLPNIIGKTRALWISSCFKMSYVLGWCKYSIFKQCLTISMPRSLCS